MKTLLCGNMPDGTNIGIDIVHVPFDSKNKDKILELMKEKYVLQYTYPNVMKTITSIKTEFTAVFCKETIL